MKNFASNKQNVPILYNIESEITQAKIATIRAKMQAEQAKMQAKLQAEYEKDLEDLFKRLQAQGQISNNRMAFSSSPITTIANKNKF